MNFQERNEKWQKFTKIAIIANFITAESYKSCNVNSMKQTHFKVHIRQKNH